MRYAHFMLAFGAILLSASVAAAVDRERADKQPQPDKSNAQVADRSSADWQCPWGGPGQGRGQGAGWGRGYGPGNGPAYGRGPGGGRGQGYGRGQGGQGQGRGPGYGRGAGRGAGGGWGPAFIDENDNGICDRFENQDRGR